MSARLSEGANSRKEVRKTGQFTRKAERVRRLREGLARSAHALGRARSGRARIAYEAERGGASFADGGGELDGTAVLGQAGIWRAASEGASKDGRAGRNNRHSVSRNPEAPGERRQPPLHRADRGRLATSACDLRDHFGGLPGPSSAFSSAMTMRAGALQSNTSPWAGPTAIRTGSKPRSVTSTCIGSPGR